MDIKELISTLERIYFQEGNLECAEEYMVRVVETPNKVCDGKLTVTHYKRVVHINEANTYYNTPSLD